MSQDANRTKLQESESIVTEVAETSDAVLSGSNKPKYASFLYRLGAFVIDYLILQTIALSLLILIAIPFIPGWFHRMVRLNEASRILNFVTTSYVEVQSTARYDPEYDQFLLMQGLAHSFLLFLGITLPILVVVSWLYYAAFDASKHQGTPGKLALGLKVTDLAGHRIGFLRATGRHFAMYLSALSLIGYLFPLWTEKKQTLHDLLAGCVVVKKD